MKKPKPPPTPIPPGHENDPRWMTKDEQVAKLRAALAEMGAHDDGRPGMASPTPAADNKRQDCSCDPLSSAPCECRNAGTAQEHWAVVAYMRSREAYYRQREREEKPSDIERAVFFARVATILGREADDLEAGEHRSTPCAREAQFDAELSLLGSAIEACNEVLGMHVIKGDVAGAIRKYGEQRRPEARPVEQLVCASCDDPDLGPRQVSEMTHCAGCYAVLELERDALHREKREREQELSSLRIQRDEYLRAYNGLIAIRAEQRSGDAKPARQWLPVGGGTVPCPKCQQPHAGGWDVLLCSACDHAWKPGRESPQPLPAAWASMSNEERRRHEPTCRQCGRAVEDGRRIYDTPMCHACLPPPEPLPVAKPAAYVDAEQSLSHIGAYVQAWRDGDNALHALGHIHAHIDARRSRLDGVTPAEPPASRPQQR